MRQKEFELRQELTSLSIALRSTALRNNASKLVEDLDILLEKIDALEPFTFEAKGAELKRNGFTTKTKLSWKKSIASIDDLPKNAKLGQCHFVENKARYFTKGSKKWIHLPTFYVSTAKANQNTFEEFLLEGV